MATSGNTVIRHSLLDSGDADDCVEHGFSQGIAAARADLERTYCTTGEA